MGFFRIKSKTIYASLNAQFQSYPSEYLFDYLVLLIDTSIAHLILCGEPFSRKPFTSSFLVFFLSLKDLDRASESHLPFTLLCEISATGVSVLKLIIVRFMKSKEELFQKFSRVNLLRQNNLFNQTRVFQELLMFMDYKIRKEVKSFTILSICGGERNKFMVDLYLEHAFSELSLEEKLDLYEKTVTYALQLEDTQNQNRPHSLNLALEDDDLGLKLRKEPVRFRIELHKGFLSWITIFLTIDGFKVSSDNEIQIDLRNYLLRKSKKTDRECHVLEAIHQSEPKLIRFSFLLNEDRNNYLPLLQDLIDRGFKEMLKRMFNIQSRISPNAFFSSPKKPQSNSEDTKIKLLKPSNENMHIQVRQTHRNTTLQPTSVVEQMLKTNADQYLDDELSNLIDEQNEKAIEDEDLLMEKYSHTTNSKLPPPKYFKNVFIVMFPFYNLDDLEHFENFKSVYSNTANGSFIFQSNQNHLQYKMELLVKMKATITLKALFSVPLYKNWHPEIVHGQVKLSISSENSAIVYQKHKALSKWYRERDYLYLRHVFKMGESYYIADKSIENSNFVPFETIHRGKIAYQIIKVTENESGCRVIIECQIEHGGLLNRAYMQELTMRYLKGFEHLRPYYENKVFQNKLVNYFRTDWNINERHNQQSAVSARMRESLDVRSIDFQQEQEISRNLDEDDVFFSIKDGSEKEEGSDDRKSIHEIAQGDLEIVQKQYFLRNVPQIIQLDEEGLIILPKKYLKIKHPVYIMEGTEKNRITLKYEDFLRRNHWVMNEQGGFKLINKQIIAAQDNVLSFIMSTLKKNIFSGKGALNISLPVTIFNCDSNLQRLCLSLSLGPEYLEKAAKLKNPVERMKHCFIFGLTNSLLYFDIEKPFNPILGETYQGFIAGCPVYAQQVSHHPPITAIYFLGRGYKVYASIEATVNIHLNSGDGINIGWYHIVFDDGQQVCFQTPPAQFSGLTLGDRKFQFKDKGYYYDRQNLLYGEMKFEDDSGLFSSKKWIYKDQIEANLYKVTEEFLNKFISSFTNKKLSPSSKEIREHFFKIEGRWPFNIFCEGERMYSVNQDLAYELIDYQYPLNSNSNYREDLYYRKKNDLSRSQSEKERLEVIQRGDRKFREKYHGKKAH